MDRMEKVLMYSMGTFILILLFVLMGLRIEHLF